MKNKYTYLLITFLVLGSAKIVAQIDESLYLNNTKGEFLLKRYELTLGPKTETNPEVLPNITFYYGFDHMMLMHNLIEQARQKALNDWFNKQHNVLKEEIEKQLGKTFSNYNEARDTHFKYIENTMLRSNHQPIENKYNTLKLDKTEIQSISLKNLKLLQIRKNELNAGNITNSLFGNFAYNGLPLSEIQSLSQLNSLWGAEYDAFAKNNVLFKKYEFVYNTARSLGTLQTYEHPIFIDLFNKQLNNYNYKIGGSNWI